MNLPYWKSVVPHAGKTVLPPYSVVLNMGKSVIARDTGQTRVPQAVTLKTTPTRPDVELMQRSGGERKPKVLVVDDDEGVRRATRRALETDDYSVVEASNGAEGLRKFMEDPKIGVVVTDFNMPQMNGEEMANRIRTAAQEHGRRVGIILLTDREDVIERLKSTNIVDVVLEKPLDRDVLLENVRRFHLQTQ